MALRGQVTRFLVMLHRSPVRALTIALETGAIERFASSGNVALYARTVDSRHESNCKKKGEGNAKCGNKHLAWAFIAAAHFAVHCEARCRACRQPVELKILGRQRQRRIGVGTTIRLDCDAIA